MRLWMLTGCRREEIASLRWQEVDFEHGCLRFGDTKTGKAVRPIGTAAIAVIKTIEQTEDSEFVFPAGEGDSYFRGYKTPWKKVIEKADRSEEHTSELQSLMRISYAVFCLNNKITHADS